MLPNDTTATLTLDESDDEFDLDVKVVPIPRREERAWFGDPDPSEPGSTCHFSCPHTCGGNCTWSPADPECSAS